MPNRNYRITRSPVRIAPNTVVTWHERGEQLRGRVLHNLPGTGQRGGSCVIRATDGTRHTVAHRRLTIVGAEGGA